MDMRKNSRILPFHVLGSSFVIAALITLLISVISGCGDTSHATAPPKDQPPVKMASATDPAAPGTNTAPSNGASQVSPGPPVQIEQPDVLDQAPPDPLPEGTQAWNFHTRTLDGQRLTLSDLRGHVTVVDFWATWCGPCAMEIPHLEAVYKEYKGKGVRMIGMSMDTDTAKQVPRFVRIAHMTYTVAVDPRPNSIACDHYNAGLLPSLFIIDQKGVVRWCAAGYHDGMMDDVKNELNKLLAEKA